MTVVNRLPFPFSQLSKTDGTPAVGWTLTFYLSGTTTLANVYTAVDLTGPTNAIVLNAYGMPDVDIFLDPDVNYKLVITDDTAATIFTYNNVRDFARRAVAHFTIYAGNPNGNAAGTAGVVGGTPADAIFDTTNGIIWICTTTGTAGTAVWTNVSSALSGAIAFTGVLTPPSFSTQQDNYNPTNLSITSTIRLNPGADSDMTGIAGGANGRELVLININPTFIINLKHNITSTVANRFQLPSGADVVLLPYHSVVLRYDSILGRWCLLGVPIGLLPAGTTTQRPASPVVGQSRYNSTTGSPEFYGAPGWISPGRVPTVQIFITGTGATYTTPAGVTHIFVRAVGGGGGGGGSGTVTSGNNGGTGGTTIFNSVNAIGGSGGSKNSTNDAGDGGAGGTGGTGTATNRINGGPGIGGGYVNAPQGGQGGASFFGGGGKGGAGTLAVGAGIAATVPGAGGGGASGVPVGFGGTGGGGAGEFFDLIIGSPATTYTYSVGAAGNVGAAGTSGAAGGAGAPGRIEVWEYYN